MGQGEGRVRRLLFLDVDGVLNHLKSEDLCPVSLGLLGEVAETTGCEIVLSSTWRLYPESVKQLESAFLEYGIPKWVGSTPYIRFNGSKPHLRVQPRCDEIKAWLLENLSGPAKVAVLDDDADAEIREEIKGVVSCFIRTDFDNGFTGDQAQRVVSFFL